MTAASIYASPPKLLCGGKSARRTRFPWGETGVLGQGTDTSSQGAWRGMGPSTYARVAEITSGRAISQQGLTATCKDRAHKEGSEARGGFWSGAWAHRSDEGGLTPSEVTHEVAPTRGNTPGGQRGPGHWVANEPGPWEDMTGTARPNLPSGRTIMVANVEARRETDGPVHYPPTVAHHLGGVLGSAARRQANRRREGCMRVSA